MSKLIVVEHHHDAQTGVYRLIAGVLEEWTITVQDLNPEFDPDAPVDEGNQPLVDREVSQEAVQRLEEFVWAADDDRWSEKTDEELVAEQRQEVSDELTRRAAERERAEAEAAAARRDLGGVGEEL